MAIGDDFSVNSSGDIRHVSGSTYYTVLQLHRWLQDLADDAAAGGNDIIDITSGTPSERSTDNIISLLGTYNIDDDAAEYLYDGSISQDGGDELYSGLVVVGAIAGTTTLQVVQDNALYDGDIPFWGTGINVDATANILCRMMIKVRTGGADIDGKRIRVTAREWGHTYAEFSVTMGLGNSVAAIFTVTDLNNETAYGTVATWTTITNTEGYQQINLNNGNGNRPYYSQWNRAAYTINQLYERTKYITRRGTAETIHGMDGELFRGITHQFDYDAEGGGGTAFAEDEHLTWGTGATAGEAVLLALLDSGSTGTMWIQLIKGVPPTDPMTITGVTSGRTCEINGSVTARSLSPVFLGTSTGSALIGAFGIGVEAADLTKDDKLFDLTNTQQTPPNVVTFTVGGLVSGEDYVLVGPKAAGNDFDFDQMTLATTLNGAGETAVVVNAIPADTPQTGTLRIKLDDGRYRKVAYTSWTSVTFTIASTSFVDPNDATAGNYVMISYIDVLADDTSEAFSLIYASERSLYVRVRDGGGTPIKTFETPATLGAGGGSATAIRTSDS